MDDTDTPDIAPDEPAPAGRLRVCFEAPKGDKPFQALRVGTFTDMYGRETTFTEADLEAIAASINGSSRKLPINEGHDYGRAVGRMMGAATRYQGKRLYITPRWNASGRALLEDEAYDGFSIELERGKAAFAAIGGALTNYPAVDGLSPLSLAAPEPGAVPTLVIPGEPDPDAPTTITETPMPDIEIQAAPVPPMELPAPPALLADPALQQQLAAYNQQMQAHFRQQFEQMQTQAQAEAQRQFQAWQAEQRQEAEILAFAQHVTTPTLQRPHALPFRAEQVAEALRGLNPAARAKVEALFSGVLDSGLVAYDRVGSGGESDEQGDPAAEHAALVLAKVEKGMSQFAAIQAVNRERPDLYRAMSTPKGGR